jgi:uncharacterized protein (TIGR00369 family)
MEITPEFLEQLNRNDLYATLGIRITQAGEGRAAARLAPRPQVCWPFADQPHGGILFTLADTTMACAVLTELDPGFNCTTIDLNMHYTAPAKGAFFTCRAWTTHRTGRLCFVRADILDPAGGVLALGQAVFRIIKLDLFAFAPEPR